MHLNLLLVALVFYAISPCCHGDSVENRLERLEAALLRKDQQIDQLQQQLGQMQKRLNTMDSKLAECITDKSDTNLEKSRHFNGSVNNMLSIDDEEDAPRTQNHDGESTPATFKRQKVHVKRQSTSSNIAFHAHQGRTRSYVIHKIVVFDIEDLDVGDGYNGGDGIYVVPATGVYVFTMTIVSDYYAHHRCLLLINGVEKGSVFADSDQVHDIHRATGITVIRVNKGDHVYVRQESNTKGDIRSDESFARSTFSGWLLFSQ